jgi:hypothetical protein
MLIRDRRLSTEISLASTLRIPASVSLKMAVHGWEKTQENLLLPLVEGGKEGSRVAISTERLE